MMQDMAVPLSRHNLARRDWGTQNYIHLGSNLRSFPDAFGVQRARAKVAKFMQRAVYPQQLTIKSRFLPGAMTKVCKVMHGRVIDGYQEDGVRVVVLVVEQDNARFIISPLHRSEFDARTWAHSHTGAE
jgi:hypothetical protein